MDSPEAPTPPPLPPPPGPVPRSGFERGCAFAGTAIAGFILFIVAGVAVLMLGDFTSAGFLPVANIIYLVAAFGAGVVLAFKPGLRGFSVGIFLGLGAVLLLISICGGWKL